MEVRMVHPLQQPPPQFPVVEPRGFALARTPAVQPSMLLAADARGRSGSSTADATRNPLP